MDEKIELMRQLVERLNQASDAYYNGSGELMTDYEWDQLFDQVKQLENETNLILENSPTNNVSADSIAGNKEPHEYLALSLAKTKKVEDLVKWSEGKPIWLSWKLDGLTLVVTYNKGKLIKVVTRGDGHVGTNITHLASAIEGISKTIKSKEKVVIRGEAVISYKDFEEFCASSEEDYANPRNLAAGSLTLKDIDELKKRKIHWIPFTLVHTDTEINSWKERMEFLEDNGFEVVEREMIEKPDQASIQKVIDDFTVKVTEGINPYPVDGLVICYNDCVYAASGSVTGHHATRAGYAFKWADESADTKLDHIEWSCAASTITPVAVFEPVELEGTTVKRASLCNISECERLDLGEKGTEISVIKANKIIPKVIKVGKKVGELVIPTHCPVCSFPTRIAISEVSATKTLKCTNPDCPAKQLNKFSRFVSKAGCNIDGLSTMTIARFVDLGWIKNNSDIYRLTNHRDEIAQLEGFGEKSADNIVKAIEKAMVVEDTKLVYALNIPLVAQDVAKKLLGAYRFNDLFETAATVENEDFFSHIDGIGPEKSSSFIKWCKEEKNMTMLKDLLSIITVDEPSKESSGKKCEGLTFVVTGDVYQFKNRDELKEYIASQGGKVAGSVSGKTSFLINNDITSTSGKNKKAMELNIPIISEQQFIEQFVEE